MKFRGVLLKPLDQQQDLDGLTIDPAGVTFSDEEIPIFRNFSYDVPKDVLGKGRVSRAEDGSLVVEGEITQELPGFDKLAIGIRADVIERPICRFSDLMAVSFTSEHADPTQPQIEVLP